MANAADLQPRHVSVTLQYGVEERPERWLLEEDEVPETALHDEVIQLLVLILCAWVEREGRPARVARNLGCRWDPDDARVGMDPDIAVIEPAPPEEELTTLRVFEPDHPSPHLAIEVVSAGTAEKDYLDAPARGARLGLEELWIFDPLVCGPSSTGGPFPLQVWIYETGPSGHRIARRIYAGAGPAFSPRLDAWLVVTHDGARLRLAEDAMGTRWWPTRAEAEAARAEAEAARADAAEAELARLRGILADDG